MDPTLTNSSAYLVTVVNPTLTGVAVVVVVVAAAELPKAGAAAVVAAPKAGAAVVVAVLKVNFTSIKSRRKK